jgi:hypothetical protein
MDRHCQSNVERSSNYITGSFLDRIWTQRSASMTFKSHQRTELQSGGRRSIEKAINFSKITVIRHDALLVEPIT